MRLEVKNVSFRYDRKGPWILENCSLSVEKGERGGRTFTALERLDHEHRKRELARLTSGDQITEAALASAEELLLSAERRRTEAG